MRLLLKWLLSAASLLFVAYVYSGVEVKSFTSALIAAFVIGLFNVVLRPVLVVLTLPVTIVTVGSFFSSSTRSCSGQRPACWMASMSQGLALRCWVR